jgi:predicted component of type VI protein secretion system
MKHNQKTEWYRFLSWVNELSAWNFWSADTWNKNLRNRKLSFSVESGLDKLLDLRTQSLIKKVEGMKKLVKVRNKNLHFKTYDE